jgi:type I restriction enzyme S subunit
VLRFWNNQWSAQPEAVLEAIWLGLQQEPSLPNPSPARGEGLETGAQLLERILIERRARWEAKQLAKFAEQGKTPPKDWQKKYPEPVQPDITGLPELPEGWVWATLSQVGWLDRGRSKHRPRNAPHLYGGPYPFVQTGDIRHADTFLSNVEATYSEAGLAQSRLWPVGTMCITIAANIGKTAILSMEACFPDSVVGFLSGSDDVSIRYVEYFMRSVQQKLEDEAPATAQKNINLEILEKVAIPVPPTLEQHQIVKLLEDSMGAARESDQAIELSLKQSAAQRQNILRAAFAGQLVPQDPDDEPASVLLERIRAERAEIAKQPKKRQPKKQKEVTTMVSKLIDVLAEAGDWLEAQEAFRRCGVADGALTERIEELYAELRKLDKAGRLAVEAVTDAQGRKLHDRLKLLAG